jgi:hypothetical protein
LRHMDADDAGAPTLAEAAADRPAPLRGLP